MFVGQKSRGKVREKWAEGVDGTFVVEDNFDKHYCEDVDKIGETTKMRYEEILGKENFKKVFEMFYFDKEKMKKIIIRF